jgi:L-2-hydroxyglutarate oxidase
MIYDIAVVGGGIIGTATAYKLSLKFPDSRIVLLEKESKLAYHQTGRNSGVIHSGIYYKPGSYKAKNCLDGRKQLVKFAQENEVAHDVCGKIILATKEEEIAGLEKIFARGIENRTEGIRKIGPEEIKELEPLAEGVAAIHVPCTGIIDFKGATRKMGELFLTNEHNEIRYGVQVNGIKNKDNETELTTNEGKVLCNRVIFCGGLQADRLAKMEGLDPRMKVVPFRGDYYELAESSKHKVKNLIYPVPNPEFPFLGVHLTRMTDGTVECGPNAVFSFDREGYSKTSVNVTDALDALTYSGTLKLFAKHWRNGINEQRRAFSKSLFLKALQGLIPSLTMNDLAPGRCGIRAQALAPDGTLIDDFHMINGRRSIHVLNAPSPAATACLSIADEIITRFETLN